jgi:nucleoside-diphosphate-sugar epimerase
LNNVHIIFGAGSLGLATANALVAQNKRVRIVSRSGKARGLTGVEVFRADVENAAQAIEAASGAAVIYNCIGLPYDIRIWTDKWPRIQANLIGAAKASGANYIFGDSLYMYGDTNGAPVNEDSPNNATTKKGKLRTQIAQMVQDAHARGEIRSAIVRGSDFFGPTVTSNGFIGERSVGAMLRGKPALLVGNIDLPHTYTFIEDFGQAMAVVGERAEALGQIWHAPNVETLTTRQMMQRFADAAKLPIKFQVIGNTVLILMGLFVPFMRELGDLAYSREKPYIVESDKITRLLGLKATPLPVAVQRTLDWYGAQPQTA